MSKMNEKNLELGCQNLFYCRYLDINTNKLTELDKRYNHFNFYEVNSDVLKCKKQPSQIFDSSKSLLKNSIETSDFSSFLDDSKSCSNNTGHNSDFLEQNIINYVHLLKKFITQFQKSINKIKIKNFSSKSKVKNYSFFYKISSKKFIDICSLIKSYKKFRNWSKFLIEWYDDDSLFSELEKLFKNDIKIKKNVKDKIQNQTRSKGSPVGRSNLKHNSSLSSMSSSSLNESFADKKITKNKISTNKQNLAQTVPNVGKDSNSFLNYESIFKNDTKRPHVLSNFGQSTPKNQSFSNDTGNFFSEKLVLNPQEKFSSMISNSFEQSCSEMPKKDSSKRKSNAKPKTSKYKTMTRNEYEALKVQLNVFREDYRLEFYEKMHMKDFYEQKLKKMEFLNTKLSRELDRFKLNQINDPFEGSALNIA